MAKKYTEWRLGFICGKCKNAADPRGSMLSVCPDCGYRGSDWKAVSCRTVYTTPWWYFWFIDIKKSIEIKPDDPELGYDEYAMPPRIPVEDTEI